MKKKYTDNASAVIGKGIRIDAGLLIGKGVVRVEGEYYGDIKIDGELIVEKAGQIHGNILTGSAYISGSIIGNIKCTDLLHIRTTGAVKGDLECDAILMDEGALFMGYSKMNERIESDPLGIEDMLDDD